MPAASPNFMANDTINPSTIVGADTVAFKVVSVASDSIKVIGVAQDGTHDAPGVTGAAAYAAKPGQGIRIFGIGEETLCVAAAAVVAGDLIKPTTGGKGTPVTGSETYTVNVVGKALEPASGDGVLFRILVQPQQIQKTGS